MIILDGFDGYMNDWLTGIVCHCLIHWLGNRDDIMFLAQSSILDLLHFQKDLHYNTLYEPAKVVDW